MHKTQQSNKKKDTITTVYGCAHFSSGAQGGQKRTLDLPELEVQAVVSTLTWMLGAKCCSPARAVSTLNH